MHEVTVIRIFVSSPSDVKKERNIVEQVAERISRNHGDHHQPPFRYEVKTWEKDVVPRLGPPIQNEIDRQIGSYDVYLGILSGRFGRPSGEADSGTEAEFEAALKKFKDKGKPWILVYFNEVPAVPASLEDGQQLLKVLQFKERIKKLGLFATYRDHYADKDPSVPTWVRHFPSFNLE